MAINVDDLLNELSSDEQVKLWQKQHSTVKLFSTDSKVIPYDGIIYNVSGSSKDPKEVEGCEGCSWRQLLIKMIPGIEAARCFVENTEAPYDSTHYKPDAAYVGGHMTTYEDGHVEEGGESYLMPLCKWDNNPSRNETPFQITKKHILRLDGYMLAEPYVTFAARMPVVGDKTFGLVYLDEVNGFWRHKDIDIEQAKKLNSANPDDPNQYILIEKSKQINDECKLQDICMI